MTNAPTWNKLSTSHYNITIIIHIDKQKDLKNNATVHMENIIGSSAQEDFFFLLC